MGTRAIAACVLACVAFAPDMANAQGTYESQIYTPENRKTVKYDGIAQAVFGVAGGVVVGLGGMVLGTQISSITCRNSEVFGCFDHQLNSVFIGGTVGYTLGTSVIMSYLISPKVEGSTRAAGMLGGLKGLGVSVLAGAAFGAVANALDDQRDAFWSYGLIGMTATSLFAVPIFTLHDFQSHYENQYMLRLTGIAPMLGPDHQGIMVQGRF